MKRKLSKLNTSGEVYALVYSRVSSERQKSEGHGLDSQTNRCADYALRKGYKVDRIFKDAASGGGDYTSRPGQVALLDHIDQFPHRKFVVIVDEITRVARDVVGHFELRRLLKDRGVEMESPNFNFEDTPEGELVEGMMAMVSQYHRKGNRRQVVQKMKARMEAGYWPFGGKKGYKIVKDPKHGKLAIPDPKEAPILKEAIEGFATGRFIRKVNACTFLVEKGLWRRQKPERYIDKFDQILRDSFYAGYMEYSRWEVSRRPGQHEAIISMKTYELNQARLSGKKEAKTIRKDISDDFPIRGLVICSDCKGHLTAGWSKGRSSRHGYYFCQNTSCPMYRKNIVKKDIEDKFTTLLKTHKLKDNVDELLIRVFEKAWSIEIKEEKNREENASKLKENLEKKVKALSELAINAQSERVRKTYESQMEDKLREIDRLDSEALTSMDLSIPYRTALSKSKKLLKSPYNAWKSLDLEEKHQLFYFVFDEKLPYSKKDGYRTAEIPIAIKLFEEFVTTNSQDVEMPGIEPGCKVRSE